MACYAAYLEIAGDGMCLGHVVDLPGCMVRAHTREVALRRLPAAIRDYHAWLRRHGEAPPPLDESIEIEVAGEAAGWGPFDPGDTAALFPPDLDPVTPEEMERYFHLMAFNRADLLALVQEPSDDLLDWRPDPDSYNLRRVLRHIGNADQWYVSRIVPPETLPPEWEDDEDLPPFECLDMARRTAIDRLRQLTGEQRSGVFYPTVWTEHPEEPWTARKVLRRFLEHEREHTAQVRQILAGRRRWLLARLAAARAQFLEQVLEFDESTLTGVPLLGDWTIKDLLAHHAAWDRWEERAMRTMVSGGVPDFSALDDFNASNAAFVAESHDHSLQEVVADLQSARAGWVAWLESLTEEEFFRPRSFGGYDWSFDGDPLRIQWQHDTAHAKELAAFRESGGLKRGAGSKAVLVAALAAAREELLAAATLVPADACDLRRICGEWTVKDLLGHIADWEWFGAEGLRQMAAGQAPDVEPIGDLDTWNAVHVEARREQSWEMVWQDLHDARWALQDTLERMGEVELSQSFPFPWGPQGTPYQWAGVYFGHDREHARDLQAAMGLDPAT
jgi:uncharacterized damage-inducible protein DinB/predicted RNase H-like HicB family nuclease